MRASGYPGRRVERTSASPGIACGAMPFASASRAYSRGVKIAMGTDAGVMKHGTNLRELGLMCGIGMTPMDSIVATTKVAAECLCP